MKRLWFLKIAAGCVLFLAVAALFMQRIAYSHCDSLDGPVIKTARTALEKGDVTPVLKWVSKEDEGKVRTAFNNTHAVRGLNPQAKELADMYFFETLVRLHRAGEGFPYTGLKPAGAHDPVVDMADKALETGNIAILKKLILQKAAEGIDKRFSDAVQKKRDVNKSVEAGRAFVGAYIEFVHYVEGLAMTAEGTVSHHEEPTEAVAPKGHAH